MENDNFAFLEQVQQEIMELANKAVTDMQLPTKVDLSQKLLTMGSVLNRTYLVKFDELTEKYGVDHLSRLTAIANKHYKLACYSAAYLEKWVYAVQGYEQLTERQLKLSNPESYADVEGLANTLNGYLALTSTIKALESDGFQCEDCNDVLDFMGLYWLNMAEVSEVNSDKYDLIAEALNAFNLSYGDRMFHVGISSDRDEATYQRSKVHKKLKALEPVGVELGKVELEFYKVKNQFKRYGYGAEFARKMQRKYPLIIDEKTILKLITKLKKLENI
ncbi:MAG: hypothetical protein ABIP37_02110 [Methylotenera sp.]